MSPASESESKSTTTSSWTARLRKQMAALFSLSDLQQICFDLGLDFEELGEGNKSQKIMALIHTVVTRDRFEDLLLICRDLRPLTDWQPYLDTLRADPAAFIPEPGSMPGGDRTDVVISGGDFRGATVNIQSTIVGASEVREIEDLPPESGDPPYIGLQSFDEADADRFFGREMLTAKLVGRLFDNRFLAVIGASGSGKSSLVKAGVIPALRQGKRLADGALPPSSSAQWAIYRLAPSAHPLEALAATLLRDDERISAVTNLTNDLAQNSRTLSIVARKLLARQGRPHLLLVIDQFEEIFTLCRQPEERQAFVDNLTTAVDSDDPQPITILLTLRADFYAQCAQYEQLRQHISQQQEYIGAMSREELARAVVEPARLGKWRLQEGLVQLMLDDVGVEPGALPLLAHALRETWTRRRGRTLTLSGYTEAGGVRGAIAQTAETIFQQRLTPAQRPVARAIFIRLTELGDQAAPGTTAAPDTRRRVEFSELITRTTDSAMLDAVLNVLIDGRLVTTSLSPADEVQLVEVAHEALIREWPTLRQWLNENREDLLRHRALTDDVNSWLKHNHDPGYLYRGLRLQETMDALDQLPDPLSLAEQEFLDASQAATAEEQKRARQLQSAQKRQRSLVGLAIILLLAVTLVAAYALGAFSMFREPGVMSGGFNIAVAEMEEGEGVAEGAGTAVSERIAAGLENTLADFPDVKIWHDNPALRRAENVVIGVVAPDAEPEQNPQAKAESLDADVLIYGSLIPTDGVTNLQLQMYLAPQFGVRLGNMAGIYQFTSPVPIFDPLEPGLEMQKQVDALAQMALGLSFSQLGESEEALVHLQQAAELVPESDVAKYFVGQELFHLSNTSGEDADIRLEEAEAAFMQALQVGDNVRARIGLSAVQLKRAQALLDTLRDNCTQPDAVDTLHDAQAKNKAAQEVLLEVPQRPQQVDIVEYGVPVGGIVGLNQAITHRISAEIHFCLREPETALAEVQIGLDTLEPAESNFRATSYLRSLARLYQTRGTLYHWQTFLLEPDQNAGRDEALQKGMQAFGQCLDTAKLAPVDQYLQSVIVQLCENNLAQLQPEEGIK